MSLNFLLLARATCGELLVVTVSDVFDFLIDAFQVPLKYPANDRHCQQGGEDREHSRIFQGNTDAHVDFFCRNQRLHLMPLASKFEGLTMVGTEWGTNRGTIIEDRC